MNLINTGTDPWLLEYDACETVAREIMEHLNFRNSEKISVQEQDALSAKIRIRLKQFSNEVSELNKKLSLPSVISALTIEERERRKRQVEGLLSRVVQLQELFNQRRANNYLNSGCDFSREQLFEKNKGVPVAVDSGSSNWGNNSSSLDSATIQQMKREQERLIKEQNEGLESLLNIVTAQTQIATSINNEVEHHNEILVDIADGMERVDGRLHRSTDMVKVINKKENIWGYWLVAFLLFVSILGVAFV